MVKYGKNHVFFSILFMGNTFQSNNSTILPKPLPVKKVEQITEEIYQVKSQNEKKRETKQSKVTAQASTNNIYVVV